MVIKENIRLKNRHQTSFFQIDEGDKTSRPPPKKKVWAPQVENMPICGNPTHNLSDCEKLVDDGIKTRRLTPAFPRRYRRGLPSLAERWWAASKLEISMMVERKQQMQVQILSLETPAQRLAYPRNLTKYRGGIISPPWDNLTYKNLGSCWSSKRCRYLNSLGHRQVSFACT